MRNVKLNECPCAFRFIYECTLLRWLSIVDCISFECISCGTHWWQCMRSQPSSIHLNSYAIVHFNETEFHLLHHRCRSHRWCQLVQSKIISVRLLHHFIFSANKFSSEQNQINSNWNDLYVLGLRPYVCSKNWDFASGSHVRLIMALRIGSLAIRHLVQFVCAEIGACRSTSHASTTNLHYRFNSNNNNRNNKFPMQSKIKPTWQRTRATTTTKGHNPKHPIHHEIMKERRRQQADERNEKERRGRENQQKQQFVHTIRSSVWCLDPNELRKVAASSGSSQSVGYTTWLQRAQNYGQNTWRNEKKEMKRKRNNE